MAKILHEFGFKIQGCIDKQEKLYGSITRNGNILSNRRNVPKDTPALRKIKARGKFVSRLMQFYKPVFVHGYPKQDPSTEKVVSRVAQFMKYNTGSSVLSDRSGGGEYKWDVATDMLTVSRSHGRVPMATGFTLTKGSNKISAAWSPDSSPEASVRNTDKLVLVVIPDGKPLEARMLIGTETRNAGAAEITIPTTGVVHAYAFFYGVAGGASEQVVRVL